ncbi:MAG: SDR family oxidoreductase [Fimbriimonadaceae bacterium]
MKPIPIRRVFLTGSTGYIGGRLAPRLLDAGYTVRCLARSEAKLRARPWAAHEKVEVVEGDVSEGDTLVKALQDCEVAYYLIHSMETSVTEYRSQDLTLAENFGQACSKAGIQRIIYLGGLGEFGDGLSKHLTSRREVETALGASGVPITVLRAAMIIGSGSASFEILRYLVERLPVMITPKWVTTESQPIAIRDVLFYLVEVLTVPETINKTIDIGGPDVLSYSELMRIMASALGLHPRFVISVPVLTPRLSSLWIHLVTPLHASIARPLAEGLRNRVVCRNDDAIQLMPHNCLNVRHAIDASVMRMQAGSIETFWSDAGIMPGDPTWAGGTEFVDQREAMTSASVTEVWKSVSSLGGAKGYRGADWLWSIRGGLDRLVGGPGLRRGRRDSQDLRLGDSLDFWRVTAIDPPNTLILTAEMKLPGTATLSFNIEPLTEKDKKSRLIMTAKFRPRGLFGIIYWYMVVPLHGIVFNKMLHGLLKDAENTPSN